MVAWPVVERYVYIKTKEKERRFCRYSRVGDSKGVVSCVDMFEWRLEGVVSYWLGWCAEVEVEVEVDGQGGVLDQAMALQPGPPTWRKERERERLRVLGERRGVLMLRLRVLRVSGAGGTRVCEGRVVL
jgi:hypothetical protein